MANDLKSFPEIAPSSVQMTFDEVDIFPINSSKEVVLSEDISASGISEFGGVSSGITLPKGMKLTDVIKALLIKELKVTYDRPTGSTSFSGTPSLKSPVEVGTKLSDVTAAFRYNDGTYTKDPNIPIKVPTECSALSYSLEININGTIHEVSSIEVADSDVFNFSNLKITAPSSFIVSNFNNISVVPDGSIIYTGKIKHSKGVKTTTNRGTEISDLEVCPANTLTTNYTITGQRLYFYGYDDGTATIDSTLIRGLQNSKLNARDNTTFDLILPLNSKCRRFIIAYPNTIRDITKLVYVEDGNSDYKGNFAKQANPTKVEGLNGYNAIDYKVFVYNTPGQWNGPVTFRVTI